MSTTEVWERVAHVCFALALLGGLPVLAGTLIGPSPPASRDTSRAPVVLVDAAPAVPDVPDVSLAACERQSHPAAP